MQRLPELFAAAVGGGWTHHGVETLLRQQVWNAVVAECSGGEPFRSAALFWLFADPTEPVPAERPTMAPWIKRRAGVYFERFRDDPSLPLSIQAHDVSIRVRILVDSFFEWWCDSIEKSDHADGGLRLQSTLRSCRKHLFAHVRLRIPKRGHDFLAHLLSAEKKGTPRHGSRSDEKPVLGQDAWAREAHADAEEIVWLAYEQQHSGGADDFRRAASDARVREGGGLQVLVAERYFKGEDLRSIADGPYGLSINYVEVLKYRGTLRILASLCLLEARYRSSLARLADATALAMIQLVDDVKRCYSRPDLWRLATPQTGDSATLTKARERLARKLRDEDEGGHARRNANA